MKLFNRGREPMPAMPREISAVPVNDTGASAEVTVSKYAPKRFQIRENDQAQDAIENAVNVLNNYRDQVVMLEQDKNELAIKMQVLERRCADYELTIAQLRNDLILAHQIRDEALRETSDWRALYANTRAMWDSFEAGTLSPAPRRRKADKKPNGEVSASPALTTPEPEKPASEAPIGEHPV